MYRNTRWHLVGSIVTALGLVAIVTVDRLVGMGWAVALGSVMAGIGCEVYQKIRGEGVPSVRDAALSSVFGVVGGIGFELFTLVTS